MKLSVSVPPWFFFIPNRYEMHLKNKTIDTGPKTYEKIDEVWNSKFDWLTPSQFLGTNSPPSTSTSTKVRFQDPVSNKGVRRLEMATDARSRGVQGHVVRSSIVVSPGGKVWKMCPRYETSPQRYENKHLKVWKKFLQGMKFLYRSMKKVFKVWK